LPFSVLPLTHAVNPPSTDSASAASPAARAALRASATLVVVRDAPVGIEVLLLRRAENGGDAYSGAWVFPGGMVEARDSACHGVCGALDDAAASGRLGLSQGGLDLYVAAVRECFEECGLLFANPLQRGVPAAGDAANVANLADPANACARWRVPLHRGEIGLADLCREAGLALAVDRLIYFGHWVTPVGRPKRFDTRFFLAEAPPGQVATHDDVEMVEQRWFHPADALARSAELRLLTPIVKTLEAIAGFDTVPALLAWARAPRLIVPSMPHMGSGRQGLRPVAPDEPAWAELRRIDPEGRGNGRYEIVPDEPVRLSARVIRVSADNGSVMTGPGTNTYLIDGGNNDWAVIDPGPLAEAHVQAVLDAAPGPIRWIFATHTHRDHSPATTMLKERTGARVYGRIADHPEWQDETFAPDELLAGGERFALSGGGTLRAIHTPGHASNHICYLLEEEKTLFTGDHVMQLSTVVINPPDGDMAAYVASLQALCAEGLEWLAPGHGFLMTQPRRAFEWIIAHRLKREAKVVDALRDLGPAPAEVLLAQVYDDVPQRMHAMAMRSLKAHLFKLRAEARANEQDDRWALAAPPPN
jgi:glyoxylase-like metal-dependent hydrolase (beta-lactamase superfamily II)/8-oxo-dGTP pyrophosphatase MutT (NUDIX family)